MVPPQSDWQDKVHQPQFKRSRARALIAHSIRFFPGCENRFLKNALCVSCSHFFTTKSVKSITIGSRLRRGLRTWSRIAQFVWWGKGCRRVHCQWWARPSAPRAAFALKRTTAPPPSTPQDVLEEAISFRIKEGEGGWQCLAMLEGRHGHPLVIDRAARPS